MAGRPMDQASYPPTGTGHGRGSEREDWQLAVDRLAPPPPRIAVDAV